MGGDVLKIQYKFRATETKKSVLEEKHISNTYFSTLPSYKHNYAKLAWLEFEFKWVYKTIFIFILTY